MSTPEPDRKVDVVVIGMGVAGEGVSGDLADAGLDVLAVEDRLVGGTCPYWGCIPTKMMVRAADLVAETRRVEGIAGKANVTPDWAQVARRIRQEATADWNDGVAVDRFTGRGGQFVRGRARLAGPGRVVVNDDLLVEARRGVVLATGSTPAVPELPGLADTPFWTNREAVEASSLPGSLAVLGGGAIGLELAQVFARFGVAVTVVESSDRLLAVEEPEASSLVRQALDADGVTALTSAQVSSVVHDGRHFALHTADGVVEAEKLLVATGRRVDLSGLGLDTVGLDPTAAAVPVDGRLRAAEKLWAVGDVTGHGVFTHLGTYQAGLAVRDILGSPGPDAEYDAVPRVTFTDPEIGAVGPTEAQAREQGVDVRTGLAQVPSTTRGWIHKAGNDGFIKLVVDGASGLLVGATSAGPNGGEVLGALAVAGHGRLPVERLRHMIYAYPTFYRGIESALADLDT
jgi:pyruvate/2-oxoglutarate dehydrogenase complex dihydrolipoamide dehydrogenase (E3) component